VSDSFNYVAVLVSIVVGLVLAVLVERVKNVPPVGQA